MHKRIRKKKNLCLVLIFISMFFFGLLFLLPLLGFPVLGNELLIIFFLLFISSLLSLLSSQIYFLSFFIFLGKASKAPFPSTSIRWVSCAPWQPQDRLATPRQAQLSLSLAVYMPPWTALPVLVPWGAAVLPERDNRKLLQNLTPLA